MKLQELLSQDELEYYSKFNPKCLEEISIDRYTKIKEISIRYRDFFKRQTVYFGKDLIFKDLVFRFATENHERIILAGGTIQFKFNNQSEIFLLFILILDPTYKMAKRYLGYVEQTQSNSQALIMHKQYAKRYNSFFEIKILQGELVLLEREKELNNQNNTTRKRTIIG